MKEYVKYEIENTVQIDYLVSCFEMTYDRTFTFSGETHDFWEFVYVADGAVGVTAGDRVAELGKGQIIFHQPMEFHRIWSIQDTTPHVVIMSFGAQGEGMDHYKNGIFRLDQREENYLWKILKQAARIFDGFQVRPRPGTGTPPSISGAGWSCFCSPFRTAVRRCAWVRVPPGPCSIMTWWSICRSIWGKS